MVTEAAAPPAKGENVLISEHDMLATTTALFVIQNLPEISFLEKLADEGKSELVTIGDQRWSLSVLDDKATSSGEESKVKFVRFTSETDRKMQRGIVTENDFGLALGSILGDTCIFFENPTNLTELMDEQRDDNIGEVKKSFAKTHDITKTAIELDLRPDYVSRYLAPQPK